MKTKKNYQNINILLSFQDSDPFNVIFKLEYKL